MSQTPIESDRMVDRRSVTPMKFIPVNAQTTLQPTVTESFGAGIGMYKFGDFDPLAPSPVLTMQIVPAYRIQIQDIFARGNATPGAAELIFVDKVTAAGPVPLLCTLTPPASIMSVARYVSSTAGNTIADFTIDPEIGDFIRVRSPAGVTGGVTVIIIFSQIQ